MRRAFVIGGIVVAVLAVVGAILFFFFGGVNSNSIPPLVRFLNEPESRDALVTEGGIACEGAPFIMPTEGFIGLLYADPAGPYNIFNRHTGIDIFGDGPPGSIPVYAAYDGYLTREADWKSSVIIKHADPLQEGRIIWTYYTHMATTDGLVDYIAADFPPGTSNRFVEQGTLLGYQGDFAGENAQFGIATHLHFSIVQSDNQGGYLNEADLSNTLDPSPYLGMNTAIYSLPQRPIRCPA